jgi:hypothetical protein
MRVNTPKAAALGGVFALLLVGVTLQATGAQTTTTGTSTSPTSTPTSTTPGTSSSAAGQQRPWDSQRHDQFLSTVASKLGVSIDQLKQAFTDARGQLATSGQQSGPRQGAHGPGFFGVAAQALGISVDQLRQELSNKSLADVAKAHNKDPKAVADALKADASARIDQLMTKQFTPGQWHGPGSGH